MDEGEAYDTNLAFRVDPNKLTQERGRSTRRSKDRNEAEKDRRDRTNAILGKLADSLWTELKGNRKLDKCSILCLVVNKIRINKLTKECITHELSSHKFLSQGLCKYLENIGNMLVEHFMIIRENEGTLLYATQAVTDQFGHSLVDVIGHSMYDIIHPDDRRELERQFYSISGEERKEFRLRLLDNTSKHSSDYEAIHVEGVIKQFQVTVNKLERVLLCHWKLLGRQPQMLGNELMPALAKNNEWISYHDLEGRLIFSSSMCAMLTGFLPHETLGLSAYSLLHPEDLGTVAAMHNIFVQEGFSRFVAFRMKTKDQRYIRVTTLTHLVTKWNKQPDYIVSLNSVLPKREWEHLFTEQAGLIRSRTPDLRSVGCSSELSNGNGHSVDSPSSSSSPLYHSPSDMSPSNSSTKSTSGIVTISAKHKIHVVDTNPIKKFRAADAGLPPEEASTGDLVGATPIFEEVVCLKPNFLGENTDSDDISVTIRTNIDSTQSMTSSSSCPSHESSDCLSPETVASVTQPVDNHSSCNSTKVMSDHIGCPHSVGGSSGSSSFDSRKRASSLDEGNKSALPGNGTKMTTKKNLLQNINRSMASSSLNPQHILTELQKPSTQPLIPQAISQKIQNELFDGIDDATSQALLSNFTLEDTIAELDDTTFTKQLQNLHCSSLSRGCESSMLDLNPEMALAGLCSLPATGLLKQNPLVRGSNSGLSQLKSSAYLNEYCLYGILPESPSLDIKSSLASTQQENSTDIDLECNRRDTTRTRDQSTSQFTYQATVAYQGHEKDQIVGPHH